jgi:DNA-binding transcriptional MerR regulator
MEMYIGELASKTGLKPKTIRFYEEMGLLPAPRRSESGYRLYPSDAVDTLRFVRTAQGLGLTLAEIRDIIRYSGQEGICDYVEHVAIDKLSQLDSKIEELQQMRKRIAGLVSRLDSDCCETENDAASSSRCTCREYTELLACVGGS